MAPTLYGDQDASVLDDVSSRGYDHSLMWSCDSLGWKGLSAVYLFHVGSTSQDGPALPGVISELRSRGYSFGLISTFFE